ncbi:MAG: glycine cleavage system aminomethyltransferase GcvT [Alphaproteobacteria bacterium]|nr:glycine cleavage system aminomethyltransferase GcvT [Alphaproteobacteria bacterium]
MAERTPLYDSHLALGAKTGPFAGYDMPLYYKDGVLQEHLWTRAQAGLFDVSHMGQAIVEGAGAVSFLERITPSSFQNKPNGRAQYTVLTNEAGGIVDDLIITRLEEQRFFLVFNAGCKDKDIGWMKAVLPDGASFQVLDTRALIALQGPKAAEALMSVFAVDTSALPYMAIMQDVDIAGAHCYVSRLGYTGEDGFEISVPGEKAALIWSALLRSEMVKPVGLAARDSLRLEMGYPLYGHDIDDTTSPVEAGLSWVMGKDNTGFIGADKVLAQKAAGPERVRVGVRLLDKGVAREGSEIRNDLDVKIGMLTSGGFSPSLEASIGMGYVPVAYAAPGTKIFVTVRGRNIAAEIAAMPFVPARTKSMKKLDTGIEKKGAVNG